jgi:plastocyanin
VRAPTNVRAEKAYLLGRALGRRRPTILGVSGFAYYMMSDQQRTVPCSFQLGWLPATLAGHYGSKMRGTINETAVVLGATIAAAALLLLGLMPTAGAQTEGQRAVVMPTTEISAIDVLLIEDNHFAPTDALVEPETMLMWVNRGQEQHTVTANDGSSTPGC